MSRPDACILVEIGADQLPSRYVAIMRRCGGGHAREHRQLESSRKRLDRQCNEDGTRRTDDALAGQSNSIGSSDPAAGSILAVDEVRDALD